MKPRTMWERILDDDDERGFPVVFTLREGRREIRWYRTAYGAFRAARGLVGDLRATIGLDTKAVGFESGRRHQVDYPSTRRIR